MDQLLSVCCMHNFVKNLIFREEICLRKCGQKISSIKHDLARTCFQFWLKIGDEGDKISRKKLARRYRSCFILKISLLSPLIIGSELTFISSSSRWLPTI